MDISTVAKGAKGELVVARKLKREGFSAITRSADPSSDWIVDGIRVDVKYSTVSRDGRWRANIHHWGRMRESAVDAYVICLDAVPNAQDGLAFLIFESPVKMKVLSFSLHSLNGRHKEHLDNWDLLRKIANKICQNREQSTTKTYMPTSKKWVKPYSKLKVGNPTLSKLCRQGHVIGGENIRLRKNGAKTCRTCFIEHQRQKRKEKAIIRNLNVDALIASV